MIHPARRLLPRGRRALLLVAALVALLFAMHLGLAGLALAHWGWSVGVVAAVVLAKVLAIAGYHLLRARPRR